MSDMPDDTLAAYEERAAWSAAFVEFQKIVANPKKNKTLRVQGRPDTKYADLGEILEVVRPVLAAHGLGLMQDVTIDQGYVSVTTRIVHKDGHTENFGPLWMPAAQNAQGIGSAITYARRYALSSILGIAADDDDDANSAQVQPTAKRRETATRPPVDSPSAETARTTVAEGAPSEDGGYGEGSPSSGNTSAGLPDSTETAGPLAPAEAAPEPDPRPKQSGSGRRKHELSVAACADGGHAYPLDDAGHCGGCGKRLAPAIGGAA